MSATTVASLAPPPAYRCGKIAVGGGAVRQVRRRLLPRRVSIAEVWWRKWFRGGRESECQLYWHIPWGSPGVLAIDYLHAGRGCHWRDIVAASRCIDEIARERGCLIAVCHVSNDRLSDRVLQRLGFQRHCLHLRGRHFIKRYA